MKYVLMYDSSPELLAKAPQFFPAHSARCREFGARGKLLMIGPLVDADGGAMGVFSSREAAMEFLKGDPFVVNGIVLRWRIREWKETTFPV